MRNQTISNLRFLCIFAMLFVHVEVADDLIIIDHKPITLTDSHPLSMVILIFKDGFGRVSAPLLGFLSGFFVSANLQHRSYPEIIVHRLRTLYLPLVVWSSILVGIKLVGAYAISDTDMLSRIIGTLDANSFLGLAHWPLNYPLHYLVDLFKCILFLPVLLYLLDRFGLSVFVVLIGCIFLALVASDPNQTTRGFNDHNMLPRADLFLFFCVGLLVQRERGSDIIGTLNWLSVHHSWGLIALGWVFLVGAVHWRWLATMDDGLAIWSGFILLMATRVSGCLLVLATLRGIGNLGSRRSTME